MVRNFAWTMNDDINLTGTGTFLLQAVAQSSITLGPSSTVHGNAMTLTGAGAFFNNGRISSDAGKVITVNTTTVHNNGVLEAKNGGTLGIDDQATLSNFTSGTMTGGTLRVWDNSRIRLKNFPDITTNNATIDLIGPNSKLDDNASRSLIQNLTANGGSLSISGGRNLITTGPLANSGSVSVGTGSVMGFSTYSQSAGTTGVSGTLQAPSSITGGTVTGIGTIVGDTTNGGAVAPGATLGSLNLTGNYTQGSAGDLQIEIGGTPASSSFDALNVTGNATLDGALHVTLANGFTPTPGMSYVVLNCTGTISGQFSTVPDPAQWNVVYGAHTVSVVATASKIVSGHVTLQNFSVSPAGVNVTVEIRPVGSTTPLDTQVVPLDADGNFQMNTSVADGTYDIAIKASHWLRSTHGSQVVAGTGLSGLSYSLINGDVNGDNAVSLGDFAALRAAFGSTPGAGNWNPNADLNGDQAVSLGDFAILRSRFGQSGDQ
jgi:hypothetical protein